MRHVLFFIALCLQHAAQLGDLRQQIAQTDAKEGFISTVPAPCLVALAVLVHVDNALFFVAKPALGRLKVPRLLRIVPIKMPALITFAPLVHGVLLCVQLSMLLLYISNGYKSSNLYPLGNIMEKKQGKKS